MEVTTIYNLNGFLDIGVKETCEWNSMVLSPNVTRDMP